MRSRDQSVLVQALLSTPTGIQAINRYISLWQHYPPLCANTLCLARTFRRAPLSPERRFYIPSRFLPSVCLSVCVCDSVSGCSTSFLFLSLPLSFSSYLSHSSSFSVCVFLPFTFSLPLYLSLYISITLSPSLCLFLSSSLPRYLTQFIPLFLFLSPSLSHYLSLSFTLTFSLSLSFPFTLSLAVSLTFYLSHSLSSSLSLFLFALFIFSLSTFYR